MSSPAAYVIGLIQTDGALGEIESEWKRLYDLAPNPNPFLSFDWSMAWRSYLCPPSRPFVLTARKDGALVGVLPLRLERKLGARVLKFLVDGRADYLGPLVESGVPDVASMLFDGLYSYRKFWDVAVMRNWSEAFFDLGQLTIPNGLRQEKVETLAAHYLRLNKHWDELISKGPAQLRRLKRKLRKFEREGGVVEFFTTETLSSSDQIAGDIIQIEKFSWKAGTRAAQFQTKPEQEMLKALLNAHQLRRVMQVWLARVDGSPVAFLINFATPERVSYYQGAFDQRWANLSPGAVLHYHAIRRAWESECREYDFMMGDESWKHGWTDGVRSLRQLSLHRITPRSLVAHVTIVQGRTLAKRFARSLGLTKAFRR